jgi:hypothetical protein
MGKLPEIPVKVEVGAKATLEIKAEIPTASAGRLVDALTDIIRPWSETRGLKADLIRLQREDVALEIARRAARRIELENADPHPIPLKVLIPLLEKGSQEEANDDFMIDMWANLLAAATFDSAVSPRFVGIIGELNGRQARLLRFIATEKDNSDATGGSFDGQQQLVMIRLTNMLRGRTTVDKLAEKIHALFQSNGTFLDSLQIYARLPSLEAWSSGSETRPEGDSWRSETDLEVLASLGLLERVDIHREVGRKKIDLISLHYYRITYLAADFLEAVGPRERPTEIK